MLRTQSLALALSALALVAAQTANYTVNPDEISAGLRGTWCQGELNTCRTLCANSPKSNDCDTTDLKFNCTCQNGSSPGLQYYTQSMPTFICEQAFQDCIAENANDQKGQEGCTKNIKNQCGTLDPNKADTGDSGPSTTTASKTASSGSPTGTGSSPSTTTTDNAAPMNAVVLGNSAAVVAAGLFAAFL